MPFVWGHVVFSLPVFAYDPMSMQLLHTTSRFSVQDVYLVAISPDFEGVARLDQIDFTKDFVELGPVRVDSDLLRWSLEDAGL